MIKLLRSCLETALWTEMVGSIVLTLVLLGWLLAVASLLG